MTAGRFGLLRDDLVVLLDEERRPVGTAPKASVHTTRTPLHLAFSAYLFDRAGSFLLTRRALDKAAFPGVWTNSCCGHPAPGEDPAAAVVRRVRSELGAEISEPECVVPDFAYRAADASGVVENEVCPVFAATVLGPLRPDPVEVAEWEWIEWPDMLSAAAASPQMLSPWAVLQVRRLGEAGFLPPHPEPAPDSDPAPDSGAPPDSRAAPDSAAPPDPGAVQQPESRGDQSAPA